MSYWIGPTVKQLWNYAMQVLHKFFRFNINTTAFCLGRSSLHLLLLKSSMTRLVGTRTHSIWILTHALSFCEFMPSFSLSLSVILTIKSQSLSLSVSFFVADVKTFLKFLNFVHFKSLVTFFWPLNWEDVLIKLSTKT